MLAGSLFEVQRSVSLALARNRTILTADSSSPEHWVYVTSVGVDLTFGRLCGLELETCGAVALSQLSEVALGQSCVLSLPWSCLLRPVRGKSRSRRRENETRRPCQDWLDGLRAEPGNRRAGDSVDSTAARASTIQD